MAIIDRNVPIPIYYQLKKLILNQIEQGALQPGDKVPTEAELCEHYNISRTPVRQALLELTREGVLTRMAGRGTFVSAGGTEEINLRVTVPDDRWQWLLKESAQLWNKKYPEATMHLSFTTVPLSELHDQLSLAIAQGQAPDISILDSVWVAEFAHRRYLYPLSELDSDWVAEMCDIFYPSLLAANSYEDEPYAIPTNADTTVLWYRRDWLATEGLAPPRTWSELVAVGRHFRKPAVRSRYGIGRYPLAFLSGRAGGETTTYQLLPFFWSAGGDLIAQGKVVLDSSATRQALAFLRDLVHVEALVSPDMGRNPWDGALRAFALGKVAMAFGGTYENFLIQSVAGWDMETFLERVGFAPLPAGPTSAPATLVGGMTYGIYRQSRHPMEALGLLKWALTLPVLKPFSIETGQHPAISAVAQAIRPEEDGFLGLTEPLFTQARSRPSLPDYARVSEQIQEMVEICLTQQLPIEAVLRRTAERISGITGLPIA